MGGSLTKTFEDCRIRPVEPAHIADLIRIGDDTRLSPWTAESYLAELKIADAILLRLEDDQNSTLGFIVGRMIDGGAVEVVREAEIYNIAVVADAQGHGFGQKLYDAFLTEVSHRGAKHIWLEVRESNSQAIAFYERNGFERVQTRSNFYANPREHALLMRAVL